MPPPEIRPNFRELAGLVALTVAAAAIASWLCGMQVRGLLQPALLVALFGLVAWLRPWFRYCFASFALYVAFSTAFVVLLYALGTSDWPLADRGLSQFDLWMRIDSRQIALVTSANPLLDRAMLLIYFSAIPQTIFLLIWMGFRHDRRLSLFLYRYMVCGLITAACFYFVPAIGAMGTDVTAWNQGPLQDLLALRSGQLTTFVCGETNGIVTFPSFHAIWAVLLMLAMPCWPMVVLNSLMVVSTVTSGGHYLIDVVGGLLVCGFVVPMTARQFAAPADAPAPVPAGVVPWPLARFFRRGSND